MSVFDERGFKDVIIIVIKNPPANAGDARYSGSIPGLGRFPGVRISIPVFLPGKSHGQRSLEGYSPRDHKESNKTEHASLS